MLLITLRQSVMKSIQGKVNGKSYIIVAAIISRERPRGIAQTMAIGKDNHKLIPEEASHVLTIMETNTPVQILVDGNVLYIVE
jgi:hypothetical protein